MAPTYEELNGMTVAQLREVAEGQDSDDLKGFRSMHKAPLLELLCKVLGVEQNEHHIVLGMDKASIKSEMRELKVARNAVIEAHAHVGLKIIRRKIHSLNRKVRRATV